MVSLRLSVQHVTALLLAWIAVPAFLEMHYGSTGLGRWTGYSVLTPVVAGALLPLTQTLLVASVSLVVTTGVFLFVPHVSPQGRFIALAAVVVASGLGVLVCRLRVEREERVTRLMVARDRLSLLSAASARVGTTLDVARTARELAEVAVPRFADVVSVDLFDAVVAGDDPGPGPPDGPVTLRRVAYARVPDDGPRADAGPAGVAAPGAGPAGAGPAGVVPAEGGAADADADAGTPGADAGPAGAGPASAEPVGAGPLSVDARPPSADDYASVPVPAHALAGGGPLHAGRLLDDAETAQWLGGEPQPAAARGRLARQSGIAVPLRARGTTLGVAVFIRRRRSEPFDQDDVLLVEEIAARAAVCLDNAHRYTREHKRSLTLQRSLLPRTLPRNAAVDTASGYLPAGAQAGVGGDWFDVIPLSGARVALVVGDVVGHGLHATATMGRLRAALRTLADIDLAPDELLTHLDDVVIRLGSEAEAGRDTPVGMPEGPEEDLSGEVGATCLYAVYDPVAGSCVLARAGHPQPALMLPDGTVDFLDLPSGPPLGLGGLPFEAVEVEVPEGSVLALFTDGLVESRHRGMDEGLEQLRHALAATGPSLDTACATVLTTMLDDEQNDDIALLLARTHVLDDRHVATWDLPAEPAAVGRARELADAQLAAWGLQDASFTMELVVSELVTNAIRYGEAPVRLRLIREDSLICEVSDASSTAPHLRRARTMDEGGRGLFIVAQLTERWGTRHGPYGKTIWSEMPVRAA